MLLTSHDLLNIVIAISVFLLSVFTCAAIYYVARILEQVFSSIKEMRERVNKVDEVIKSIKEKVEHSSSYFLLIGEGIKKLVEMAMDYSGKEKKTKRK